MIRIKAIHLLAIIILFSIFSCEKTEGPGGSSEIVGRVWVRDYNQTFTILNAEYWAQEERVYIMYGSDPIYSDDTRTNFDGLYRFQGLREGDYKVFVYSKDSTWQSPSQRVPVFESVTVANKGKTYEVPTITILN